MTESLRAAAIAQPIIGFHTDEEGHWVARLACGHNQHVRHNPPWMHRVWVTREQSRRSMIGYRLACKKCVENAPRDDLDQATIDSGDPR